MGSSISSSASASDFKQLSSNDISNYVKSLGTEYETYSNQIIEYELNGESLYSLKGVGWRTNDNDIDTEIYKSLEDLGVVNLIHKKNMCSRLRISLDAIVDDTNNLNSSNFTQQLTFTDRGIYLHVLDDFILSCGGESAIRNMTTNDVCERFVKIRTSKSKCCYCKYLEQNFKKGTGKANVFISHAWEYCFVDLVNTLKHHFRIQDHLNNSNGTYDNNVIIWLDLFSWNQHVSLANDFSRWINSLKSCITHINHTVLVIDDDPDFVPLRRTWCLFEMHCSIESSSKVEIAMSTSSHSCYLERIKTDYDSVQRMIAAIDIETSESTHEEDKENIIHYIKEGFSANLSSINNTVLKFFHSWTVSVIADAISQDTAASRSAEDSEKAEESALLLKEVLAEVYRSEGKYQEAERLYLDILETRKRISFYDFNKIAMYTDHLVAMYFQEVPRYAVI